MSGMDLSEHFHYISVMNTRRHQGQGGSGKRKADLLQVRLNATEKQAFEDAASLAGLGLSAWVRERLRKVAAKELEESGIKNPFTLEPRVSNQNS